MSLYTGKILHRYQWTEIPIDDYVIYQVRDLYEEEDAKKMTDDPPVFEWAPCVLITDNLSE